jgi:hypothetical protein
MKKFFILMVLATTVLSSGMAQCDTLFNLVSPLDTPTVIAADTGSGAGYLSGNNMYGDLAKAEAFTVDSGFYLISATFHFGVATINPTDSNTTVNLTVWNDAGGVPGNVIDTVPVTLGQIALAVGEGEGLRVFFTGDSSLAAGVIYVGVVLPAATGDTLALLTNTYSGPDGNGYELNPVYGWNTYDVNWGDATGSLGNYIRAYVCSTPPSGNPASSFSITGGNDSSACSPTDITFSDSTMSPSAPTSYFWSFGDGSYANGPDPTHTYTAGGSYMVTESVTTDTGNVVRVLISATTTVNVVNSPQLTTAATPPTSDTTLGSATVTASGGTGNYFYSWSDGTLGNTLAEVPGTYYVIVLDQNGCSSEDSVTIPFPLGILQLGAAQVKVYPIPAADVLNLVWSQPSDAEISIVDMTGNVVSTMISNGEMNTVYDIHGLAAGAYILRITDKTGNKQQNMAFSKL